MRVTKIDIRQVEAAIENAYPGEPTEFNTNFHTLEEAPDLPTIPSQVPTSFKRWLPLVLRTRNLSLTALQIATLTPAQTRLLLDSSGSSLVTGVINRMYAEDIEDEIVPALKSLVFPPEGLFLRLDACSPKDGVQQVPGRLSVHSVDELILRLVTSYRARSSFLGLLNKGAPKIEMFALPFDARMRSEREYRVFCAPGNLNITAVSQYQWHKPWLFSKRSEDEIKDVVSVILGGIEKLHKQILGEINDEDEADRLLRAQGFTFDALFDDEKISCELIELNGFGIRSACGSCLFQWIKDRDVLYGVKGQGEVEFRVAVEDSTRAGT